MADDHSLGQGIWQRGGVDVENLPDPFALPPAPEGPHAVAPKRRRPWLRWGFTAFGALLLVTL